MDVFKPMLPISKLKNFLVKMQAPNHNVTIIYTLEFKHFTHVNYTKHVYVFSFQQFVLGEW